MNSIEISENEQLALRALIACLQLRFPGQLCDVLLYGSKARGDSTPDSDIDVLIILSEESEQIRHEILNIASQTSLEYDVLLSPHVIGEARFREKRDFTYYRNVARDAIQLTVSPAGLTLTPAPLILAG